MWSFDRYQGFVLRGLKGLMGHLSLEYSFSLFWNRIILVGFLAHAQFHFVVFRVVLSGFEAPKKASAFIHPFIYSFTTQPFIYLFIYLCDKYLLSLFSLPCLNCREQGKCNRCPPVILFNNGKSCVRSWRMGTAAQQCFSSPESLSHTWALVSHAGTQAHPRHTARETVCLNPASWLKQPSRRFHCTLTCENHCSKKRTNNRLNLKRSVSVRGPENKAV